VPGRALNEEPRRRNQKCTPPVKKRHKGSDKVVGETPDRRPKSSLRSNRTAAVSGSTGEQPMAALVSRSERVRAIRLARSQPESLPELLELGESIKARAVDVATRDRRVRARLEGTRSRVLAVDYREEKDERGRLLRLAEVCFYDYDADVLVVATISPGNGRVVELQERRGAPPITKEERAAALRVVARHERETRADPRRRSGTVAFPTPSYAFDAEPTRQGHRGCTLYYRDGPGRIGAITVDLSAGDVVPDESLPEILRGRPSRPSRRQRGGASDAR
jgi:hypothetical protein